jgi:hypothetical protein
MIAVASSSYVHITTVRGSSCSASHATTVATAMLAASRGG